MRSTYAPAAAGMAFAILFITSVMLPGASTARADISGYRRCVGNVKEVPLKDPDPQSLQLARLVEMDLKSGASPSSEAQKLAQMGFDPRLADAVVQCVVEENP